MFCGNCGKKIEDGAKFCPYCGAAMATGQGDNAAPSQDVILNALDAGTEAGADAPAAGGSAASLPAQGQVMETGNSRRSLGLLAGLGGAAAVLIVLAAVLLGGMLSGPKGTLGKAVTKSVNAWQATSDAIGMPDLKKLRESKKVRADLSVQFKSFGGDLVYYTPELEMLEGFGFSASAGIDLPGRKMDFSAAANYGSAELLTLWVQADDDVLSIGCPELLDNKSYGLSTATLGRDLNKLGAELDEGMEEMSFNLFDIMETFSRPAEVDKAAKKALTDAIEVEKTGKSSVDVNGHAVDCTGYHVVIPQNAMRDYLDALEDACRDRGLEDDILDLLETMGIPDSERSYVRSELVDSLNNEEMFDALEQAIKAIGDVELDVYVSGGYVMAVVWEDTIEGSRVELTANFGGGKNYADDVSLDLWVDDVRLRYESTGSHGTEDGAYTDSSSFRMQHRAMDYSYTVKSEMEYYPNKASDNFVWTVKGDGFSVEMEGQLTTTKDSLFMDLNKLSVSAMGSEMVRLGASYAVRPYSASDYAATPLTMLSSMDEDDFQTLAYDVAANAQRWAMGLISEVPELMQLFW